jgi:hypothetical protein
MRDVAVLAFAETRGQGDVDETEMLFEVIGAAVRDSGLERRQIGFTVSGSCDFVVGRPFSFVTALDAAGAWPPIAESHLEMDGAWALHEAWVQLQTGEVDAALVYAFSRSSLGPLRDVLALQLDPYLVAPLGPDALALARLQARALIDAGRAAEADLPGDDEPLAEDGAAAMVIAAGPLAARGRAWIRGIDHRIEGQSLGARDLTRSPSTRLAAARAGAFAGAVDHAELHAPFRHQPIILREALGLETARTGAAPIMVAGLARVGHAARAILDGRARRALAHATSGPCLQQNLVCVLEAT